MIIFEDLTPDELFDKVQINIENRKEQEFENGYDLIQSLDNIDPLDNDINIWWHSSDENLGELDLYVWPFTDLYENISLTAQLNRDGHQEIYSESPISLDNRQDWWDSFVQRVVSKLGIIDVSFEDLDLIED
jgi:hypothetical protein|nr:MAG TPA: hypothetical protein [Caudoviricetes sp.]